MTPLYRQYLEVCGKGVNIVIANFARPTEFGKLWCLKGSINILVVLIIFQYIGQ